MRPEEPLQITSTHILLVEGRDDQQLFEAARVSALIPARIQVVSMKSKSKLQARLEAVQLAAPLPLEIVGVVVDADADSTAAFDAAKAALAARGVSPPDHPYAISSGAVRAGVAVIPADAKRGERARLETSLLGSLAGTDALACAESFLGCIARTANAPADHEEALVSAWLATLPTTCRYIGEAAAAGYLNLSHPCFAPLWFFLNTLFAPPASPTTPSGAPLHA